MSNIYEISCPITGYLPTMYESYDLSDVFDSADVGALHDIDITDEETNQVKGYYTFKVKAKSEQEALLKARAVFDELWNNGKVDCGDIEETELAEFENGEEFRFNGIKEKCAERE